MLTDIFTRAKSNDHVAVVLLTGAGDKCFCAGADLGAGFDPMVGPLKSRRGSFYDPVGRFMSLIIAYPKPIVAAVNGLAVGVGFTLLPLCDVVFCTPAASFSAPFTQLAVTPEFCSSFTFPRLMGTNMATDVLLFGRKLTAADAQQCRLVHDVLPASGFVELVRGKLRPSLGFVHAQKSMHYFKTLMRTPAMIAELESVHRTEMALLDQRATGAKSNTSEAVVAMQAAQAKAKAKL